MATITTSSGIVIAPQIQLLKRPTSSKVTDPIVKKEPVAVVAVEGISSLESRIKAYETAKARIYSEPNDPKKNGNNT
jgi:hypothetical protein